MCETPLAEASKSPATAPEKELDDVDHMFAGEPPRGRYDAAKQQFPLITNSRLSDLVGLGEGLGRWQSTLTNKYFAPTKQRGCQSLRLAEHKELNVQM